MRVAEKLALSRAKHNRSEHTIAVEAVRAATNILRNFYLRRTASGPGATLPLKRSSASFEKLFSLTGGRNLAHAFAWCSDIGGPLAWRIWADKVAGGPVDAGHFSPEEISERTAAALAAVFEVQR